MRVFFLGPLSLAPLVAAAALSCESTDPPQIVDHTDYTDPETPIVPEEFAAVSVDISRKYQAIEGFGASAAWYQSAVPSRPDKAEIYDLLFAELGLDILRFRNIWGNREEDPENDISAEVELYEEATRSLGHPPRVLLTSWSPPATLKASGKERCAEGDTPGSCTLITEDGEFPYGKFADYWADSLDYYAEQGIVPDYISIQNEPDYQPGSWEGCVFRGTEQDGLPGYDQALHAVVERLEETEHSPRILGPETLGIHSGRVDTFLNPMDTSLLYGVAHHLYSATEAWRDPEGYVRPMRSVASAAGQLPVFMTEYGTEGDQGIEGGFEIAWLMHNSIAEGNASAFLYWELYWPDKGLLAIDFNQNDYRLRDHYYAMRHYARFTDPGYLRVDATPSGSFNRVTAYVSPEEDQLTVVVLNTGRDVQEIEFDLGEEFSGAATEVYRTIFEPGHSDTWKQLDALSVTPGLILPPRSMATIVAR